MKLKPLINLGYFLLFYLICTGILFTLSAINNDTYIIGIWWNISWAGVLLLLLAVVFMCIETKSKEKNTYCHYYKFSCQLLRQVKTKVWCWVYSSFLKILQIFNRFEVSPQIRNPNNTANDHTLHGDNLTPSNEDVNQKRTIPMKGRNGTNTLIKSWGTLVI